MSETYEYGGIYKRDTVLRMDGWSACDKTETEDRDREAVWCARKVCMGGGV